MPFIYNSPWKIENDLLRSYYRRPYSCALTVSPPKMVPHEVVDFITKLRSLLLSYDYYLIPEYANDRLHWHGVIKVKNEPIAYLETKLKEYLKCQIKIESNPRAAWYIYIFKEYKDDPILTKNSPHHDLIFGFYMK